MSLPPYGPNSSLPLSDNVYIISAKCVIYLIIPVIFSILNKTNDLSIIHALEPLIWNVWMHLHAANDTFNTTENKRERRDSRVCNSSNVQQ